MATFPSVAPVRGSDIRAKSTSQSNPVRSPSSDESYQFPPKPPDPGVFREEIERTFIKAEESYSDVWRADPDDLYAFLEATDSSSPPERLFLIQLYRAAGRQLRRGVTVPECESEWYLEISPPKKVRRMLKGWSTEIWLQIHAQQTIKIPIRDSERYQRHRPDFLVKVQVDDVQSGQYGAGPRVIHTPLKIAVEVDGFKYHYDDKTDIERDVDRYNRFASCGIQSVRCNAWEVNSSERGKEEDIGERILDLLWGMAQRKVLEPSLIAS